MNRIGAFIVSLIITLGMTAGVYAAAPSSVKVSGSGNNAKTVTYQYTAGKETAKPITSLITEISNLAKKTTTVTQVITITSESADNSPVDFKLRLVSSATPTPTPKNAPTASPDVKGSILGFYDIKVRDSAAKVIAESKAGDDDLYVMEDGTIARDIDLGVLNKQSGKETKIYNIEISIDGDETTSAISQAAKQTEWQIVSGPVTKAKATETPAPTGKAENADEKTEATAAPLSTPEITEAPKATETPAPTQETYKNGGTKFVGSGKDIKPGRYVVTGNGMVKVYNGEDELQTSILLTDGKEENGNGVDSYVLNLTEGQKLEYSDYINLKPYTSATTAPKATTKATTAPKATAKSTTAPKAKATATPAPAASKTNPKTGDNTPIAGLSVVAVFALGMFAFMEINRRKNNN